MNDLQQQLDDAERIPKATIDILKDQVFGFDTFFVTSQEPYEVNSWAVMVFLLYKSNLSIFSYPLVLVELHLYSNLMHTATSRPALGLLK
jgi:hypothetical protein